MVVTKTNFACLLPFFILMKINTRLHCGHEDESKKNDEVESRQSISLPTARSVHPCRHVGASTSRNTLCIEEKEHIQGTDLVSVDQRSSLPPQLLYAEIRNPLWSNS